MTKATAFSARYCAHEKVAPGALVIVQSDNWYSYIESGAAAPAPSSHGVTGPGDAADLFASARSARRLKGWTCPQRTPTWPRVATFETGDIFVGASARAGCAGALLPRRGVSGRSLYRAV